MLKNIRFRRMSRKAVVAAAVYVLVKWSIIIFFGSYLYNSEWFKPEYFAAFPMFILLGIFVYYRKTGKLPFKKINSNQ